MNVSRRRRAEAFRNTLAAAGGYFAGRVARRGLDQGAQYVVNQASNVITGVARAAKRSLSSTGTTEGKSKKRMRTMKRKGRSYNTSTTSKSGGFLTSTVKPKTARDKFAKAGAITHVIEQNSITSGADCITVGHHTRPNGQVRFYMWAAVVKLLMEKADFRINELGSTAGLQAGDKIVVEYAPTLAAAGVTIDLTLVVGNTYFTIVSWLSDPVRPWNATTTDNTAILMSISRLPANAVTSFNNPGYSYLKLSEVTFHYMAKSSMKMQNRTINAVGDDEEDVDNVPLYGRSFEFKGDTLFSGAGSVQQTTITCNQQYGYIVDASPQRAFEPVLASQYKNVKKYGKVHIDPGHIKTSVLTDQFSGNFVRLYSTYNTGNTTSHKKVGVTRVFQVEKMINSTPAVNIQMAWEINLSYSVRATEKKVNPTIQTLEKVTI